MTRTLALAWELYGRQRWLMRLTGLALLLLAVLVPVLPAPMRNVNLVGWALVALTGPMIFVLANLSHGFQGRLEGRPSLFPRRLLVLPASALELALAPLALGTLAVVLASLVGTAVVLPACGKVVPILLPALLGAAGLSWLQAMCWLPFPLSWSRLVAICLTFPLLFFAPLLPPGLAEGVLFAALAASYALAVTGAWLARLGTFVSDAPPSEGPAPVVTRPWLPFTSPAAAQLWLEWRIHGWLFLFGVGMALFWLLPLMALVQMVLTGPAPPRQALFTMAPWLERAVAAAGTGGAIALLPLGVPILIVMTGGPSLAHFRRAGIWGETPTFYLTRPLTDWGLVALKWRFAAVLVAFAWGLALLVGALWVGLQGMLPGVMAHLAEELGPAWWLLLAGAFVGLIVVSWMWMASGLWAGLWRSMSGTAFGPVGTLLFVVGWAIGKPWLAALGVVLLLAPVFQALRGWRLGVGLAALVLGAVLALAGWSLFALPIIPVPGMLAALPAMSRRRHA